MRNLKITALLFGTVISSALCATSASAYQFGAPPITEIADSGTSRGRNSFFYLTDGGTHLGVSGVINKGSTYGGSTYLYRLGTSSFSESSGAYSRSGKFFGLGKGWEWDLTEDRHIGVIANLQFDYRAWSNSAGSLDSGTGLSYGLEFGGLYRHFIEENTLTSFAILSVASNSDKTTQNTLATAAYWDQANVYHGAVAAGSTSTTVAAKTSAVAFGVDYMMGKASVTGTVSLGSGNTKGSKSSLMITAGYNF